MATMKETSVNLGSYEILNFKYVEKLPPNSPFTQLSSKEGVQTTPQLARGYVPGSAIDLMNNNLAHVCDFKFIFNFDSDLLLGLTNPVTAIKNAIKNAKMNATNMIRNLVKKAMDLIRAAIKAILKVISFDPSGEFSYYWALGESIVLDINEIIKEVAEAVEIALTWVFFIQQIQQLIEWIKSLPDKFKALLQQCIANFTNSITQAVNTIKSIPDQINDLTQSQLNSITSEFSAAGNELLSAVKTTQTSSDIPAGVAAAIDDNNPATLSQAFQEHLDTIKTFTESTTANSTINLMSGMSSP
jgi:phage-related protein